MLLLEILFRYTTVVLCVVLAILAIRDGWKNKTARYSAFLNFGIAAILLGSAPPELRLPDLLHIIVRFLDVGTMAFVWWMGRSMFDDDFKLGIWEWAGMAAIALPIILFRLAEFEIIERPPYLVGSWVSMVSLILMAHLAYTVMRGRKDDMIETRRKIRSYFVVGMAIAASLTVLAENLYYGTHPEFVDLFRGAVVLPMVIWAIFWLLSFRSEKLSFEPARPIANTTPTIDPRDQGLHDTLVNLMQNEKAYLEPGLTIRTLAGKLKTPEHQLRALINKGMGYRNFSG